MKDEKKPLTEDEKTELAKELTIITVGFSALTGIREAFYHDAFAGCSDECRNGIEFVLDEVQEAIQATAAKLEYMP